MISGQRGTEELGGPLRIAQLSGQVAELGVSNLISFIAVLSVNLGLINLFPIPVLDGGHLLFYLVEAVRGRPLPRRAQEYSFRAGIALYGQVVHFHHLERFDAYRAVSLGGRTDRMNPSRVAGRQVVFCVWGAVRWAGPEAMRP